MPEKTTRSTPDGVPPRKTFNIILPLSVTDRLDEEAAEVGISRTALIRVILSDYLNK